LNKQNLLKSLIMIITVLLSTVEVFATTATAVQTLSVSAPATVAVERKSLSLPSSIDPETGKHSGMNASFSIETTGTDDDFTFIVGSKILTAGNSEVSAFTNDGTGLLFGRIGEDEFLPSDIAIENAKNGNSNTANIIVYPITMNIDSPMTVEYNKSLTIGEDTLGCYQIKLNGATSGTLNQNIGGIPMNNSYLPGPDMSGTYRAVVYITAIGN